MGLVLLVRHGQASWGAADYDVLSEVGHAQARALGDDLRRRGIEVDRLVTGGMRRHRETAEDLGLGLPAEVDEGWDEFDHRAMLAKLPGRQNPSREEFQAWFEQATDRWTDGEHDDYDESFSTFTGRVAAALRRTTEGEGATVVVTSGGPVAWVTAGLIGGGVDQWRRLNPVCVNTGVTTVVTGRRGASLVTFNEHAHLARELLSYR